MINTMFLKIKESAISILPISLLIIICNFTPIFSLSNYEIMIVCVSTVILIIGMSLFNLGADLAMTPMGKTVGVGLTRQGKLWVLLMVSFILGILITVSEPDLSVLASQTKEVINSSLLILSIGIGVGFSLVIGVLKVVYKVNLARLLSFLYMILFALCIILLMTGNEKMMTLAFDSGGVTTGPITVPFLMALGVGISTLLSKKSEKDASFGFVAICSVGPIIAVLILSIFSTGNIGYEMGDYGIKNNYALAFINNFATCLKEVGIPLLLISIFFILCNFLWLKLPKKRMYQLGIGVGYTYIGLSIFLAGVATGFLPIGYIIGNELAEYNKYALIPFCFLIGALTVLAEPAIHVLNKQVEEITGGLVKKKAMLIALTIGVGTSLALSMIRIIFDFSIMYYLIPGYLLCFGLSFFVPKIYVAIAFDSGGVASGPLTSSFILPMGIGACMMISGPESIMSNGFGIVAMVAMTPLITIEFLGLCAIIKDKLHTKSIVRQIEAYDDDQIIEFM